MMYISDCQQRVGACSRFQHYHCSDCDEVLDLHQDGEYASPPDGTVRCDTCTDSYICASCAVTSSATAALSTCAWCRDEIRAR